MPEEKRARIAERRGDLCALAGRMGMQGMRDELEDLSFRVLNPEAYEAVRSKLAALREKSGPLVETIRNDLTARLAKHGIKAEILGRLKTPYSIFSKMQRKSVGFEQLSESSIRVLSTARRIVPCARRRPHRLADGARALRITYRRRSRTISSSTPPSSVRSVSALNCKSARARGKIAKRIAAHRSKDGSQTFANGSRRKSRL